MVSSNITYLARSPLYKKEKPYATELKIEGAEDFPNMNYVFATETMDMHAIEADHKHDMASTGFCVIKANTILDPQLALETPDAVEDMYTTELARLLSERFPEYTRIEPIDFVVSRHYP